MSKRRLSMLLPMAALLTAACADETAPPPVTATESAAVSEPAAAAKPAPPPPPSQETVLAKYTQSAQIAEAQGDYLAAATYRAAVAEALPEDRAALQKFIFSAGKAGLRNKTVNVLARYTTAHPDDTEMLVELGAALLADDRPEPASNALRPACIAAVTDWRACSLAGVAEDRLQRFAAARGAYEKALRISPDNAVVLNNYALSLAMSGERDRAQAVARKLLARRDITDKIRTAMNELVS